uniref:DNA helicase n=1 Tax=Timema monikensis TaxID=170555 RepID=A0A7R9EDE1_9NEOP|nr:unnamed protein product [Timema monikensis]
MSDHAICSGEQPIEDKQICKDEKSSTDVIKDEEVVDLNQCTPSASIISSKKDLSPIPFNPSLSMKSLLHVTLEPEVNIKSRHMINGIQVVFPGRPYPSQIAIMSKVIEGLKKMKNCILDSPTGSGKSLAILCSTLAWQHHEKENSNKLLSYGEEVQDDPNKVHYGLNEVCNDSKKVGNDPNEIHYDLVGVVDDSVGVSYALDGVPYDEDDDFEHPVSKKVCQEKAKKNFKPLATVPNECQPFKGKKTFKSCGQQLPIEKNFTKAEEILQDIETKSACVPRVPRIFYATRTHKQIEQVIRELGKTEYKDVRMTVLSSREHSCINTPGENYQNKTEMCKELLDPLNGPGCYFYSNVNYIGSHTELSKIKFNTPWDIEDLVRIGRQKKACPYYAARSLQDTAELIFCPYSYLIDPLIQKSMNVKLSRDVVILDEAHNIEDISRESANFSLDQAELQVAIKDITSVAVSGTLPHEHKYLLWVGTVPCGPNSKILNARFKNVNTYEFQDELGQLVLEVCNKVPYGVLVFLPSYKLLDMLVYRWQSTQLWDRLQMVKEMLTEPHKGSDLYYTMDYFYQAIRDFESLDSLDAYTGKTGPCLLAVMRGKVAEGLDFSDNNARAIITVGIPFSNVNNLEVKLKMEYNDKNRNKGLLKGADWYRIQAFRVVGRGNRGSVKSCVEELEQWEGGIGARRRVVVWSWSRRKGNRRFDVNPKDGKHTGGVDTRLFPEEDVASEELKQRLLIGLLVAFFYSIPSDETSGKRTFLTLLKKYEIIQEVDENKITKTEIVRWHSISNSTLFTILKLREEIVNTVQKEGHNEKAKNLKGATHANLEQATMDWFSQHRAQNVPINGPMMQRKADEFALKLGI